MSSVPSTDASIRELERAAQLSPDDTGPRIRLASALSRAGRRLEAISRLGVSQTNDDDFPAVRRLADELWRDELMELERAVAVRGAHQVDDLAIDPSGELLAWGSHGGGFHVAELKTGDVIYSDGRLIAQALFVSPGRVFALDAGRHRITCVTVKDGKASETWKPITPRTRLLDVSPSGSMLLLQDERHEGVYEWPNVEEPITPERRCGAQLPRVDWDTGHFLAFELRPRSVEVVAIAPVPAAGRRTRIELTANAAPLAVLGRGIVAQLSPGLTLHGLETGWRLPLVTSQGKVPEPSLSSDERGVRLALSGALVRFDIDRKLGTLKSVSTDAASLAKPMHREDANVFWHPHADVAFQRRPSGFYDLRTLEGKTLRTLPFGSFPKWTADGSAVLIQRGTGEGGGSYLEVWRGPRPSPWREGVPGGS